MTEPSALAAHLTCWLGAWPPPSPGLTVVGSEARTTAEWDGRIRPVRGVATPTGTVLSVPPETVEIVEGLGRTIEEIGPALPAALGMDRWRFHVGVFRWSDDPAALDEPGAWVHPHNPLIPDWLRPFNAEVLVGWDGHEVAAGVGRKVHDRWGQELAVVTEEGHRGKGWAKRLVAQAAHRVLREGAIPTYLHGPANEASARTADAIGFPDRGWRILGLFPGSPG